MRFEIKKQKILEPIIFKEDTKNDKFCYKIVV